MADNDPRWGQDGDDGRRPGSGEDIDALWKDFNKVMGGLFGNSKRPNPFENDPGQDRGGDRGGSGGRFRGFGAPRSVRPNGKLMTVGLVAAALLWCATGFYIVPEGQAGIVTTFGRYTETKTPGFRWHLPVPVQSAELVDVSTVRTAEVGLFGRPNREKEALMLTDDENIVDVRFTVQYRIKAGQDNAMLFLFRSKDPDASVQQAAESAMREVVGRKYMDSILFESKQEIAESVKRIMQDMLERYRTGIEVMNVAIQNAQPPQQVQAAFNDAVKAGQDRERQINEGQAYANDVVPKARGTAVRLVQEAQGYKARVTQSAAGDAARFMQILAQYEKAPQVTRDRMYVDALSKIYASTTKIFVDNSAGTNLLYLPFEKLLAQSAAQEPALEAPAPAASQPQQKAPVQAGLRDANALRNR